MPRGDAGRKKLEERWSILKRCAGRTLGDKPRVERPIDRLTGSGLSYGQATQFLGKLEELGYLEKHSFGNNRRILEVWLLKDELGEDILGPEPKGDNPPAGRVRVGEGRRSNNRANHSGHTENESDSENGKPPEGVVLFIDYYNLLKNLSELNCDFPYDELKQAARGLGPLELSQVFIPAHINQVSQARIRRKGYYVQSCPPIKDRVLDSVDATIETFTRLFVNNSNIGTFVLVSDDRDFDDTRELVLNRGKRIVTFYCDKRSKTLISDDGGSVINLSPRRKMARDEKAVNGNVFIQILEDLDDDDLELPPDDDKLQLILSMLVVMDKNNWPSGARPTSFARLKTTLLAAIPEDVRKRISQEDFHEALGALNMYKILDSREQNKDPRKYYVFNKNHRLVRKILS